MQMAKPGKDPSDVWDYFDKSSEPRPQQKKKGKAISITKDSEEEQEQESLFSRGSGSKNMEDMRCIARCRGCGYKLVYRNNQQLWYHLSCLNPKIDGGYCTQLHHSEDPKHIEKREEAKEEIEKLKELKALNRHKRKRLEAKKSKEYSKESQAMSSQGTSGQGTSRQVTLTNWADGAKISLKQMNDAVAKWCAGAGISTNAFNHPMWDVVVQSIQKANPVKGPRARAIRSCFPDLVAHTRVQVQQKLKDAELFNSGWTISWDGATVHGEAVQAVVAHLPQCSSATLIGFMNLSKIIACEGGASASTKADLVKKFIVETPGEGRSICCMCTDSPAEMAACHDILETSYPALFLQPDVSHAVNNVYKQVCKSNVMRKLDSLLAPVIRAYRDNAFLRHQLKQASSAHFKRPRGVPTVCDSRFVSKLLAGMQIVSLRPAIEATVVSPAFNDKMTNKQQSGRHVRDLLKSLKELVLDGHFWSNCTLILRALFPLVKIVRLADKERPCPGLLMQAMVDAQEQIEELKESKDSEISAVAEALHAIMTREDGPWKACQTPLLQFCRMFEPSLYGKQCWQGAEAQNTITEVLKKAVAFDTDEDKIEDKVEKIKDQLWNYYQGTGDFADIGHSTVAPSTRNEINIGGKPKKYIRASKWWQVKVDSSFVGKRYMVRLLSIVPNQTSCERYLKAYKHVNNKWRTHMTRHRASQWKSEEEELNTNGGDLAFLMCHINNSDFVTRRYLDDPMTDVEVDVEEYLCTEEDEETWKELLDDYQPQKEAEFVAPKRSIEGKVEDWEKGSQSADRLKMLRRKYTNLVFLDVTNVIWKVTDVLWFTKDQIKKQGLDARRPHYRAITASCDANDMTGSHVLDGTFWAKIMAATTHHGKNTNVKFANIPDVENIGDVVEEEKTSGWKDNFKDVVAKIVNALNQLSRK